MNEPKGDSGVRLELKEGEESLHRNAIWNLARRDHVGSIWGVGLQPVVFGSGSPGMSSWTRAGDCEIDDVLFGES